MAQVELMEQTVHDVYAYGVIAASTLVELQRGFPQEKGYAEVSTVHRSVGGEAASGAHVMARLGLKARLAGSELGTDEASDWAVDQLSRAGVDCTRIARIPGGGVTEIVVSSGQNRTIFASYGRMLRDRAWSAPDRSDVRSSRLVCLDPFFGDDSERVARWCLTDGIPYVTIDALPDSPVAHGADALVVAAEFADHQIGEIDPKELLARYVEHCGGLVILTRGGSDVWYQRRDSDALSLPSFDVDIRDTAGAGDAFRAGLIVALLEGQSDADAIRTASAVAAMVCRTSPGVIQSPTRDELRSFLAAHR